jgi:hypothetical protein
MEEEIRYIYIVIDKTMHSYEAICGIYDDFDKAMKSNAWEQYGETPDERGFGNDLFIYKEQINFEICQ